MPPRDPTTDPLSPSPMAKRNNPHAAARAIRARHAAVVAAIRGTLGEVATPDDTDLLAGLAAVLAGDGVANDVAGYLLESAVCAARMARQRAAEAAA